MLNENETTEIPVTSICMSVAYCDIKSTHMQNKFLHIESAARYKYHMQVIMEYRYLDKLKSLRLS
jgi:hypothetical protein